MKDNSNDGLLWLLAIGLLAYGGGKMLFPPPVAKQPISPAPYVVPSPAPPSPPIVPTPKPPPRP